MQGHRCWEDIGGLVGWEEASQGNDVSAMIGTTRAGLKGGDGWGRPHRTLGGEPAAGGWGDRREGRWMAHFGVLGGEEQGLEGGGLEGVGPCGASPCFLLLYGSCPGGS